MSSRDEEIKVKVTGADSAERDLDKLGDAAKGVGSDVAVMGKETAAASKKVDELGDEAKGTASDLGRLDRQILETRAAMAALNGEFERTGDAKVSAEFDKQAAALGRLETRTRTVAKLTKDLADEARRTAKRDAAEAARVIAQGRRDRRGIIGNTLGDIAGLGIGAARNAAGTAAGALSDIPGSKLAMVGVGASLAPVAGASVGGALLAGGALAGVGAGVAGAIANNPEPFRKAWESSIESISKRWQSASIGFQRPTLASIGIIKKSIDDINFEGPLKTASQYVEPLAHGVAGFLTNFGNGMGKLIDKAGPIILVLEKDLPLLGKAFDTAFGDVGDGAEGAAAAIDDVLQVIGVGIIAVGKFAKAGSDMYAWAQGLGILGAEAPRVQTFGRALHETAEATEETKTTFGDAAVEAARYAAEVGTLTDELTRNRATALGMADADFALAQGWLDLKEELKDGEKTLNLATQAGLDNASSIKNQIENAEALRQQTIRTGDQTTESLAAADAAYAANIEKIRQAAYAAGFNKEQVDALIKSITTIPPSKSTTVTLPGIGGALVQAATLSASLNGINRTYTAHINISGVAQALVDAARVAASMPHKASGGSALKSGFTVVGESGPEIAWLGRGTHVSTAQQTRNILGGSGGGGSGGGSSLSIAVARSADSYVGQLVQKLFDAGMIQVFDGNGQPVTTRRA